MYYNRKISSALSSLIEEGGEMRWLYDFVKGNPELDFLIGRNQSNEWISVYRGLSRVLKITDPKRSGFIKIDGAKAYKSILPGLYGIKSKSVDFKNELEQLLNAVSKNTKFDRYFKNKKEGYYQSILSRKYGICSNKDDDLVIVDKEAVGGYMDINEKNAVFNQFQPKYKKLQQSISQINCKRYGKNNEKKSVGNELDFLALDKDGNILLIEYKHGTNTSGIYLSPIQIGMYYDLFSNLPRKDFENAILEMLIQKQQLGLVCPNWVIPNKIKNIIPVLVISEYNYKSSAKQKFDEILSISRQQIAPQFLENLLTFNYTEKDGLINW